MSGAVHEIWLRPDAVLESSVGSQLAPLVKLKVLVIAPRTDLNVDLFHAISTADVAAVLDALLQGQ